LCKVHNNWLLLLYSFMQLHRCCSNPNEATLLLCISVYVVLVDVLMHAVDLHKTASR